LLLLINKYNKKKYKNVKIYYDKKLNKIFFIGVLGKNVINLKNSFFVVKLTSKKLILSSKIFKSFFSLFHKKIIGVCLGFMCY